MGWREHHIIRRGAQQVGAHRVDVAAQFLQDLAVCLIGLGQDDQALGTCDRVRAAKDRHTPLADARDIANGLFQFLRINIAPGTDNEIFGPPVIYTSPLAMYARSPASSHVPRNRRRVSSGLWKYPLVADGPQNSTRPS